MCIICCPRFMHRFFVSCMFSPPLGKHLVFGQLRVVSNVPCSGLSARRVVGRLYNASGHCNWWLFVRCHCILDAGFSSVMVCELVASCMNVCIVVFALWLFFFFWMLQLGVHDIAQTSLWCCLRAVFLGSRALVCCTTDTLCGSNAALDRCG